MKAPKRHFMASPKRETSIYPSQIVKDAPRRLGNTHDMYKAGAATHKEAESMPGTLSVLGPPLMQHVALRLHHTSKSAFSQHR